MDLWHDICNGSSHRFLAPVMISIGLTAMGCEEEFGLQRLQAVEAGGL